MKAKKIIFTTLSLLSIFGYGYFVFAVAPSGGYDPAETLDPDCAPGDTDCIVAVSGGGSVTADNGLTVTGSNVQLGGILLNDTAIDTGDNFLQIGQPLPDGGSVGFGVGYSSSYNIGVASLSVNNSTGQDAGFSVYNIGGGVGTSLQYNDIDTLTTYELSTGDNGIIMSYRYDSTTGMDLNAVWVDEYGIRNFGREYDTNPNTQWMSWNSGTNNLEYLASLNNIGDWQWNAYANTRDDFSIGIDPLVNFLYTDSVGRVLSAPLSAIAATPTNGLELISGDIGLGGELTQETLIETGLNTFAIGSDVGGANQTGISVQSPVAGVTLAGLSSTGTDGIATVNVINVFGGVFPSMSYTDSATNDQFSIQATPDGAQFILTPGDSSGPDDITGLFVGLDNIAFGMNSRLSEGLIHTNWSTYNGAGSDQLMTLFNDGDLRLHEYDNARDDTGLFTPTNFLYTNDFGMLYSAPLNTIAWLRNGNSGTTPGTDFIGTTDAQDFMIKTNSIQVALFKDATNPEDELFTLGAQNQLNFWKDGSFAYNDDNFQNDDPGTEQNMFYFNFGNHDGLGAAQTKKAIRLGSVSNDSWDINAATVGDRSIAIGFANPDFVDFPLLAPRASGDMSVAIGMNAYATDIGALALGIGSLAGGPVSVAIGGGDASGESAIAIGSANALGVASYAFGGITSGDYAYSFGTKTDTPGFFSTEAAGIYSYAFGGNTRALGDNSFAMGNDVTAYSYSEFAFGISSTDYSPIDSNDWDSGDRLFVIGNGLGGASDSDAFTILKSGITGIGYDNFETTALSALLQVNGSIQQTGADSCSLSADADGIIICTPSDENLKTNIENLTYGLDTITALRPVSYTFRDTKYGIGNQVGFLAQELEVTIPEIVTNGPDYKSVNYGLITPVIVKAIQEMNLKITTIDDLATENTWRDALIAWLGNATNGISDLFSKRVTTEEFCLKDASGQTCYTRSQLNDAIGNIGTNSSDDPENPSSPADDSGNGGDETDGGDQGDTPSPDNIPDSEPESTPEPEPEPTPQPDPAPEQSPDSVPAE